MAVDADVVIVGGSVAGAATAAFLGRRGRRVIVLERARFPRDKPCGEGLMPHGVDVLAELGLLPRVRTAGARELVGVRYTLESGETVLGRFPPRHGRSSVALGVRRLRLDDTLLRAAREAGDVLVREGFRVSDVLRQGGTVVGVTDGNTAVRARVVVGADGLRSRVRSAMGWDRYRSRPRRYAVIGHFLLSPFRPLRPAVEVVLCSGMEAYVTPLDGDEALVALLGGKPLMRQFAGDLAGAYERIVRSQPRLSELLTDATLLPGVRATGPFAVRARHVAGGNTLLVGDAAGFLDPITGEGMASSLQQARAAAGVIDRALRAGGTPDLSAFTAEHRRITRTSTMLTWVALGLCTFPRLTPRAMAGLQRRAGLFSRLLAVNCGYAGFRSVSPRDWLALLSGR